MNTLIDDLFQFLRSSPTAWHCVANTTKTLTAQGFVEINEKDLWNLQPGGKYVVNRNGSSLCAFTLPKISPSRCTLLAAHTDSPALKLKPNAEFRVNNMIMLGVEVYGSPLLNSWLNRGLGIAGRITVATGAGKIESRLVSLTDHPVTIPQLAIHLDRDVNTKSLILNKQDHLSALAALDSDLKEASYLETVLKSYVKGDTLLDTELFLYPLEKPRYVGFQKELFTSYRIDNLGSVHAAVQALLTANATPQNSIRMIMLWDNEEIGSETAQGAASPFLSDVLERACLCINMNREAYLRLITESLCVSIDMAHALHPNYTGAHEPHHQPLLSRGIVLKNNAQQRYASNAATSAAVVHACHQQQLELQKYVVRSDMPCGSTIGPIHASRTGMPTVDIGYPQLSMHSARELASCQDHLSMCQLLKALLEAR